MSARIKASIEHTQEGRLETVILPPDFVAWERKTKLKFAAGVALGFEDITYLAWKSLKREGKISDSYDTWLEGVEDFEIDESDEVVPFEPAS